MDGSLLVLAVIVVVAAAVDAETAEANCCRASPHHTTSRLVRDDAGSRAALVEYQLPCLTVDQCYFC